ncbi:hypothetical protein M9458_033305, partial [Cirrhinus mrigala]
PEWASWPELRPEEANKYPPTRSCLLVVARRTPPHPIDPAVPPWLLAPSSLPWPSSPLAPLAPPGSLVLPVLPWAVVVHPAPRDSTPLAPPSLRLHRGLTDPCLRISRWSHLFHHQLSFSASGSSVTCSTYIGLSCCLPGSSFHLICPGFPCCLPPWPPELPALPWPPELPDLPWRPSLAL